MKIIVTGGAGFIGSAVCRYLVNEVGAVVLNIDKLTYAANLTSLESLFSSPSYHFRQADICHRDAMDAAFADTTTYLDSQLTEVRATVEEAIECSAHVAFVPRTATATVSGDGGRRIFLSNFEVSAVTAATVDGVALTAPELAAITINDAILYREAGWASGYANISVTYTHGRTAVPGLIKRAALVLAKSYLVASQIPANATAQSIGDTMFRLTIAGRDGDFGIPEVDAAIKQFGRSGHWVG
jgi:NAD(P)-dependent dehydrogenase (short-subunit alcohol dehydrogenase family)